MASWYSTVLAMRPRSIDSPRSDAASCIMSEMPRTTKLCASISEAGMVARNTWILRSTSL